jgi:Zn finger protein HypA/HybF involved in hydrogenase expression
LRGGKMIILIPIQVNCDCEGGHRVIPYTIQDFILDTMKCPTCGAKVNTTWWDGIVS